MRIRIFQVDHNKDKENVAFSEFDNLKKPVDSSIYRQVYGGDVGCINLEDVFVLCNSKLPPGYFGESLSVGNVVEICDGSDKGFYYCDSIGFKPVSFDISKTNHDKMLRILVMECGKLPYEAEIRNCFEALHNAVGGIPVDMSIDPENKVKLCCNDMFMYNGSPPNRTVGNKVINGTFIIVGKGINEYGEGCEISLTDAQIEKYSEMFCEFITSVEDMSLSDDGAENCEMVQA